MIRFPAFRTAAVLTVLFLLTGLPVVLGAGAEAAKTPRPLLHNWHVSFSNNYVSHLTHYLLTAGVAFLIFYVLLRRFVLKRKIQRAFPRFTDLQREIFYSLLSIAVFSGIAVLSMVLKRLGLTQFYGQIDKFGWWYLWFSVLALIFLHDTWFYWTHRFMHWRPVYKWVHKVHHQSHNPTPWAAFCFHPLEAFVEAAFYPLIIMLMPIHPLAALIWLLYMTVMNVLGHLGFELLPRGFASHWLWRWHNTSVHHNMHHKFFRCNYGLYFNIWDRIMGTNHAEYEEQYERVTAQGREVKLGRTVEPAGE